MMTGLENLLANHAGQLEGKRIGVVTNRTGIDGDGTPGWEKIGEIRGVRIMALFSPEHGLWGKEAAGKGIRYDDNQGILPKHFSLYGETTKPTDAMLKDIDLLIYDIQDIGVRCYTYITTLGLVLEAAGEAEIPVMILDRPNPLTGTRVEGPTLRLDFRSFMGFYPIPLQYALTPGELAIMINGQAWIESKPILKVIPLINWRREHWYDDTGLDWVDPSPNIRDLTTAIVYPGTVLVEATNVSEGRGTEHPFIYIGAPWIDGGKLSEEMNRQNIPGVSFQPVVFTPKHLPGIATHPKYEGEYCHGIQVRLKNRIVFRSTETGITLLVTMKRLYPDTFEISEDKLNLLVGSDLVTRGLRKGWSPSQIMKQFSGDVNEFRRLRRQYLLYDGN